MHQGNRLGALVPSDDGVLVPTLSLKMPVIFGNVTQTSSQTSVTARLNPKTVEHWSFYMPFSLAGNASACDRPLNSFEMRLKLNKN